MDRLDELSQPELLRNLRAKNKRKLEEVAKLIGVSKEAYFDIEKGKSQLSPNHYADLAEYYCVDEELFAAN